MCVVGMSHTCTIPMISQDHCKLSLDMIASLRILVSVLIANIHSRYQYQVLYANGRQSKRRQRRCLEIEMMHIENCQGCWRHCNNMYQARVPQLSWRLCLCMIATNQLEAREFSIAFFGHSGLASKGFRIVNPLSKLMVRGYMGNTIRFFSWRYRKTGSKFCPISPFHYQG